MANKVKVKCERPILLKGGIKKVKGDIFEIDKNEIESYIRVGAVSIIEELKETKSKKKDVRNAEKQERFKEKVVTK